MKKLFTLFALLTFTLSIHAVITVINYELKDSYGDGWNGASLSIVDAESGQTWATLTISSGSESSGSVRVASGHTYEIVWNSGSFDSECSFKLTDAKGFVLLSHSKGKALKAGTLLSYKILNKGDSNGDFNVTVADVMDIVSYVLNGGTSTPTSPPTPETVDISYELWDQYGDSWNGAAIRIVDADDDEEVAVLTVDEADYSSGTVTLTAGHNYDFYWQSGEYDGECAFIIYDADGNPLFEYHGEPMPEEPEESILAVAKKNKAPIKSNARRSKSYPKKETVIPVEETILSDGEVFFSYQAPEDVPSSVPTPDYRDVNGDNNVSIADVMEVVSIVIGGEPVPDIEVATGYETVEMLVYSGSQYNKVDITEGSGDFEVVSSDPNNLRVYLSGLSFTMYSGTLGTYMVTIKDKKSGKTKDIQVIVKEAEPSCPDENHPHIIDLGLPSGTKWSCCNIDASKPEEFGSYYAWGETAEKSDYSWATYTHSDGTEETCHDLGSSICGTKYDVAHYKWGDNWYMPSYEQVQELFRNMTSFSLTSMNGVRGAYFTFPNGSSIFLPCGGWKEGTEFKIEDDRGFRSGNFWLGTPPSPNRGNYLDVFYSVSSSAIGYGYFTAGNRSLGYNVRPVNTVSAPLAISATSVSLDKGDNATVEITAGSGSYTVESSNSNIATATLNGNMVSITAVGGGSATITVADTQSGKKITISVTVQVTIQNSLCPDDHHPHMIDLGLPSGTKWACCNVGADTPEAYGGYYAWGETDEKDYYTWFTYDYFNSEEYEDMWDNNYLVYYDLGEDIGGTKYDVALAKWGGLWQMPKYDQFEELEENCTSERVQIGNVSGMLFTSKKNGSKLFLPAAGRKNGDEIEWGGEQCCYFSSTTGVPTGPFVYGYVKGDFDMSYEECERSLGYSVRPVSATSSVPHLQLSFTGVHEPIMWDEEFSVEILSGSGSYSVTSNDPYAEYVFVRLEGTTIYIHGLGSGEAVITVTDTQTGETATIEVNVYAPAPPFSLSESELNMEVGQSVTVITYDGDAHTVESSDETVAIAEILEEGDVKVTAVGLGTATITVTDTQTGETATIEVNVYAPAPPFSLSESELNMEVGQSVTVITYDGDAHTVESSDETVAIAEIMESGDIKVTAVGLGTATIFVNKQDAEGTTITVTVNNRTSLCPDDHHPHMIDLGLPSGTKWACCNVDDNSADQSPTNYGSYYAWGEVKEQENKIYNWNSYTHCDGSASTCHNLGNSISGTEFDVAYVKWGDPWMIPSDGEFDELLRHCNHTWIIKDDVEGLLFTGSNDNRIFLPAAGSLHDSGFPNSGICGIYWSGTQNSNYPNYANRFGFFDDGDCVNYWGDRYMGQSVRPVACPITPPIDYPME